MKFLDAHMLTVTKCPRNIPFCHQLGGDLGHGELHMPDRILWGLISVAVFAKVNAVERSTGTYYLSLGAERFTISEWWGREDDFRQVAGRYNQTRVKLDKLDRLERHSGGPIPAEKIEQVVIVQPYALKDERT